MNTTFQKKGAVEMSLNLIIMLVIGLTLMGLVIGFVTSFLGNAESSFTDKLSEDDQTKIDQVKRESGSFAFLSSSVKVIQGDKKGAKLYVKIRNPYTDTFTHAGGDIVSSPDAISVTIADGQVDETGTGDQLVIQTPPISLDSGNSDGYALSVYAANGVSLGTFYATFTITHSDSSTETKVLTINVE
jgi:hypothetical protein